MTSGTGFVQANRNCVVDRAHRDQVVERPELLGELADRDDRSPERDRRDDGVEA